MKANELMIGDWVLYDPNVFIEDEYEPYQDCYPIKISSGEDIDLVIENCYSPIPLTPEIFEKNGFYFGYTSNEEDIAHSTIAVLSEEDKGYVWDEGDGSIKIIFPTESDGGLVELDDQGFNRHLSLVFGDNLYVHELQHALKLCGIDKEIVL